MNLSTKSGKSSGGDKKKFLFDTNDFDKKLRPEQIPTYSEEQLLVAKNQAYNQGYNEGLKAAQISQEEKIAGILSAVGELLERMIHEEEHREAQSMINAAKLAMRVTEKLLPQLAAKVSFGEVEHVISQSLESRKDEPRIAITISPIHLDNIKERIDTMAAHKGFTGKIILLSDDSMNPGDCRVEWADGGAERIYDKLYSQIEEEFAKSIAGIQTPPHLR